MQAELKLATELFVEIATELNRNPRPPMGDSFEEWLFWQVPAGERYRSARQGVARVDVPPTRRCFDQS